MSDFDSIFTGVADKLESNVAKVTEQAIEQIETLTASKLIELQGLKKTTAALKVTTEKGTATVKGLKHKQLEELIKIVGAGMPVLMVGMAGTGKTHAAEQVAEALKLSFYAMSVGAQTSKSDIIGFIHAGGAYVPTLFRKAYEEGGVFLMDEVDAGNANVLIQINAALANNYCAFPDGMVKRHDDFRFIGTANTFGNGANRMYVGRNQLDAATLDRFTSINWEVDEKLEGTLVIFGKGPKWHKAIKELRKYVDKNDLRVLVTPRATMRGAKLLDMGFDLDYVMGAAVLNGVPSDKHAQIVSVIRDKYDA